jgi:hypothetical protein
MMRHCEFRISNFEFRNTGAGQIKPNRKSQIAKQRTGLHSTFSDSMFAHDFRFTISAFEFYVPQSVSDTRRVHSISFDSSALINSKFKIQNSELLFPGTR